MNYHQGNKHTQPSNHKSANISGSGCFSCGEKEILVLMKVKYTSRFSYKAVFIKLYYYLICIENVAFFYL